MSNSISSVIDPKKSYTFHDYFKLNPPVDELIDYFGYHHQTQYYQLPQIDIDEDYFASLQNDLHETLLYVDLTSETARREALIAPVILKLARYLKIKVRIEYALNVTIQLRGKLDYLLRTDTNFLVVEAKDENLRRGFTQLSAELIALDQWQEETVPLLYGAVSIGSLWQFGVLERDTKRVIQDLNTFQVPADLNTLLRILAAILV